MLRRLPYRSLISVRSALRSLRALSARRVRGHASCHLRTFSTISCAQGYETRSRLRDEVLPKLGADLDKLGRKFAAKKATLKEVVHLYYFVLQLPRLLQALRQHADDAASESRVRVAIEL